MKHGRGEEIWPESSPGLGNNIKDRFLSRSSAWAKLHSRSGQLTDLLVCLHAVVLASASLRAKALAEETETLGLGRRFGTQA